MEAGGGSQCGLRQVSGNGKGEEEACGSSAACCRAWVGVRTPPLGAGAQSGLGRLPGCGGGPETAPHSGAVVPGEALRREGPASHLHRGMFWRSCGAESAGARRARGSGGPPSSLRAAGQAWGPTQSGAPWRGGGGRKRAEGVIPEEGRWSLARGATSGRVELRPLARGRRGGREALALTSWGPAGDGGSGHSTPHRPPPQRRLTAASDVSAHGAGRGLPIKGKGIG